MTKCTALSRDIVRLINATGWKFVRATQTHPLRWHYKPPSNDCENPPYHEFGKSCLGGTHRGCKAIVDNSCVKAPPSRNSVTRFSRRSTRETVSPRGPSTRTGHLGLCLQ